MARIIIKLLFAPLGELEGDQIPPHSKQSLELVCGARADLRQLLGMVPKASIK